MAETIPEIRLLPAPYPHEFKKADEIELASSNARTNDSIYYVTIQELLEYWRTGGKSVYGAVILGQHIPVLAPLSYEHCKFERCWMGGTLTEPEYATAFKECNFFHCFCGGVWTNTPFDNCGYHDVAFFRAKLEGVAWRGETMAYNMSIRDSTIINSDLSGLPEECFIYGCTWLGQKVQA